MQKEKNLSNFNSCRPSFSSQLSTWKTISRSPLFGNLLADFFNRAEYVASKRKYVCRAKYSSKSFEANSLASAPLWPSKTATIPTVTSWRPLLPAPIPNGIHFSNHYYKINNNWDFYIQQNHHYNCSNSQMCFYPLPCAIESAAFLIWNWK